MPGSSLTFSRIAIPSRDMEQSKKFFTEVLGGRLAASSDRALVEFDNFAIELGSQGGGATAPHREHPHYAFTVPADQFAALKTRLEAYGVPTHEPWTRTGSPCSLMYFRDPSGNQFELFCPGGDTGLELRIGHRAGGDYVIPFPSLVYDGLPVEDPDPALVPQVRATAFNHMTLPSKDLAEGKRFFTTVFGGTVTIDHTSHVTVVVGGAEIGMGGPLDGGWTAPDDEYPHYTFLVAPGSLLPLKHRLSEFGVPTSDVFSRGGEDASVYFREPTGNLFELGCPTGFIGERRLLRSAGGDYSVDLRGLTYDHWNDPGLA
jgi:catechol 2,3-dioxygenase-like lactoylglutathione lyase family enzyme